MLFDAESKNVVTHAMAIRIAASLVGAFDPDSTVCLHLANNVSASPILPDHQLTDLQIVYPPLVMAILANQCRWTGTNVAYTAAELEHHFRISSTKYVVTAREKLTVVQTAVDASGIEAEIILLNDFPWDCNAISIDEAVNSGTDGDSDWLFVTNDNSGSLADSFLSPDSKYRTLSDLATARTFSDHRDTLEEALKKVSPDSVAALMQTSGTTGLPKMAARTHRSMVLEQQAIEDNNAQKPYKVRRLYCTPIFHGYSCPEMIFNVLRLGQQSYFMKRFDETFAQKVHDYGITETFGAPPMLLRLANNPECYPLLQSLRLISYGGAQLMPELRLKTLAMFKTPPRIVPVYGMTEGGWFTTFKYPEDDETGSVGRLIPHYQIKVQVQENIELHDGQPVGELLVKGPQLMIGYLGNDKATAETVVDGWLKTGDVGYLKDGKVYLVSRAKDMIKCSAWQVAPAELENALLQSPDISDAAVFGVGEGVDEHPMACVIPSKPNVTAEKILSHLRETLAGYKVSKCEVKFVDAIPKNPAGKILKKILRQQRLE